MIKTILISILLSLTLITTAQPGWQWGKRGGSGGSGSGSLANEQVIDMATDRNGNVYVLAVNNPGLANVDGHTGISVRDRLTIASWSCNGSFRWMKNIGGASSSVGRALGVDSADGVYVIGQTVSNNALGYTYFDTDTTLGNTNKRLFLIKYDTTGLYKWLKMPQADTVSTFNESRPLDMSVAPNGDIFWYAFLQPGNYGGGAFTITTPGYYISRFNTSGAYQGLVSLDMATTDGGNTANLNGITNAESGHFSRDHNNGRFYICGQYDKTYGTLAFGSTSINAIGNIGALPIYLSAFNSSGNVLWTKQSAANLYASTRNGRPVIDPQGNIYIGGDVYNGNTFAGHTFTNSLSVHTFPFVISLDASGNYRWASSGKPKDGACAGYSLAYSQNTIGLACYYGGLLKWDTDSITAPLTMSGTAYILLARLNAMTGALISMDSIASQNTLNNYSTAIAGDRKGNFFVGGSFDYRLFPGPDTIAITGGTYDWFVAKFGASQCNCIAPTAHFTAVNSSGNIVNFTYSGSTPYTSLSWNFGDGSPAVSSANPIHTYSSSGNYTVCVTVTNACGSHTYCHALSTGELGIAPMSGFPEISIYPNPVTEEIRIKNIATEMTMEVYTTTGIRVFKTLLQRNQEQVNVSQLSPGIYLIRLINKEGRQGTARFVKQ
ncbi:hypothetical protein DBR32_14780 [Taibaiella sp. KBW10]|uniref:PKD domain-containing protein n=1 Tax=Taibaiella sp. KBW10 TaxID=2153357 RepID=UPI000F5AD809|nr:PKD domain-containing protein [Taibaiella sp. KBW10]RQO29844.1 hypothetical protein DBR32_14780 [Taibaiella sp. KBW10]